MTDEKAHHAFVGDVIFDFHLPARSFPCPDSLVIIVGSISGGVPHDCRIVVKDLRSFSFSPSTMTSGGLIAAAVEGV